MEDAPPAGLLLLAGRHPERQAGRLDALLGPRDALRHRRLVDHERARDLGCRQPADRTQRERDRRGRRQRRMAAHEQHRQRVVLVRYLAAWRLPQCSDRLPVLAGAIATPLVDQPPLGGLDQPAAGTLRDAVPRPVGDAARSASWTASSAASKSPYLRASTPRTCGASSRSRASTSRLARQRHASAAHMLSHVDRLLERDAGRAGHGRVPRCDLDRPLLGLDVDDHVAGDPLLDLLERPVGDDGSREPVGRHDLRQVGPCEGLRPRPALPSPELLVEGAVVVHVRRDLLRLPLVHRRLDGAAVEIDEHHVSLHLTPSFPGLCPW